MKRTPLKASSHKQDLLNARWLGIKDAMSWFAKNYGINNRCYLCGNPLYLDDEPVGVIDAHHIERRSQGGSYDPENCALVHRFPCHQNETGALQWSSSE